MIFDATVPLQLKKTQKWFASIITRPIDSDSCMELTSPSGKPMDEEAARFIKPSPTLKPAERIELYNQQYWWRLLSVMQENFPFLARLFGYNDFNQAISFPYLVSYPSRHWSLNRLGENINRWIKQEYHAADKALISIAARLDWAYCSSFSMRQASPLSLSSLPVPEDVNSLLTAKLFLQPHIHLFTFNANYFALRQEMLKQPADYWVENDFPVLEKGRTAYYFILHRNLKRDLVWNELSEAEYKLLNRFQKGASVGECCDWLEKQRTKALKEAGDHLQQWFKEWVARHWLTLDNPQSEKNDVRARKKKSIGHLPA